jgi:hypothetical protein
MPLWELLERLDAELQRAILDLAGWQAAKRLRGASRAARALVNSRVERVRLPADDLITLPLRCTSASRGWRAWSWRRAPMAA